jgi:aminoglycoside phosphotransferase (APT) family kinase protein
MAGRCRPAVVHGDLCFSNILYDPQTGLVKFIDPRGVFFEEGCYGAPRYDLAKLLHSFHGGYDHIMQEMYELVPCGDAAYRLRFFQSSGTPAVVSRLAARLKERADVGMDELLLLEALLFLSMLPLHKEDANRQKALYLRGLVILNEALA